MLKLNCGRVLILFQFSLSLCLSFSEMISVSLSVCLCFSLPHRRQFHFRIHVFTTMLMCVRTCVCVCVCVHVCVHVCMCVSERASEREGGSSVVWCVCAIVCMRERERELKLKQLQGFGFSFSQKLSKNESLLSYWIIINNKMTRHERERERERSVSVCWVLYLWLISSISSSWCCFSLHAWQDSFYLFCVWIMSVCMWFLKSRPEHILPFDWTMDTEVLLYLFLCLHLSQLKCKCPVHTDDNNSFLSSAIL